MLARCLKPWAYLEHVEAHEHGDACRSYRQPATDLPKGSPHKSRQHAEGGKSGRQPSRKHDSLKTWQVQKQQKKWEVQGRAAVRGARS